jgi:signal transduction histidine kinase
MVGRGIAATREAERARVQLEVARDVHDVVGHALGVISAEAGVTRGLADAGEQELRDSLAGIEVHARRALEEVQLLVRGLRSAPTPVARLSSVVETTRAAGVDVRARIAVDAQLGDAVGAVVLRIVQESLSNVVRHAAGAACTVEVHEADGAVLVRVRDRGPGAGVAGREHAGFGLAGMSERAHLVGGTVEWGDHPGGGFEVRARLPVGAGGGR